MTASKWTTRFTPSARHDLRMIQRPMAIRILRHLAELENDPLGFDSTPLVSDPGYRRLRVGAYRVVYSLANQELVIWVVVVAHRSTVYQRT